MSKLSLKLFKKATAICRSFDTTICFGYTGEGSEVDVFERYIVIDLNEADSKTKFWSLVFHELGHIYCFDNDLYKTYHTDSLPYKKMAKYVRKMGLRIERFVDKVGRDLMKDHGIKGKYLKTYNSKEDIEWYRNWVEETYPIK